MKKWITTESLVKEKPKAIFCVDFDGTIVEDAYPAIGVPNTGATEVLRELNAKGYRLVLLTMRQDTALEEAIRYCNAQRIDFWGVNKNPSQAEWSTSPKVFGHVYIDDRSLGIPLRAPSSQVGSPVVDWVEVRKILVQWEVLEPLTPTDSQEDS